MKKVAVVFWSMTGNTEAMAYSVGDGVDKAGGESVILKSSELNAALLDEYDAVAFGCPAMGDEVLEEEDFDPMFTACEKNLAGKRIALFGSFDWGDGEWMRNWEARCKAAGANIVGITISHLIPSEEDTVKCKALGAMLAG